MSSPIGLPWGTFFTPLLYTISVITCTNTRIGSMITTLKCKSSWMINTRLIKPFKITAHPSLRKMCIVLSITRLSFTLGSYRMSGSAKRWTRSSLMPTAITGSSSVVHWRLSVVPVIWIIPIAQHWWLCFPERQGKNPWQMGWALQQCAQLPFLHQWRDHSPSPTGCD